MCINRLSPKTVEEQAASRKQHSKPLMPYSSMGEFVACLDSWTKKWTVLHNDRNEGPEATILRLAEKLTKNDSAMQVSPT